MNNSQRTKIICEGLALYSAVMNLPGIETMNNTPEYKAWSVFECEWPSFVSVIKREQYRLFDIINAEFH